MWMIGQRARQGEAARQGQGLWQVQVRLWTGQLPEHLPGVVELSREGFEHPGRPEGQLVILRARLEQAAELQRGAEAVQLVLREQLALRGWLALRWAVRLDHRPLVAGLGYPVLLGGLRTGCVLEHLPEAAELSLEGLMVRPGHFEGQLVSHRGCPERAVEVDRVRRSHLEDPEVLVRLWMGYVGHRQVAAEDHWEGPWVHL